MLHLIPSIDFTLADIPEESLAYPGVGIVHIDWNQLAQLIIAMPYRLATDRPTANKKQATCNMVFVPFIELLYRYTRLDMEYTPVNPTPKKFKEGDTIVLLDSLLLAQDTENTQFKLIQL